MMLIPVRVGPSAIHGQGLFAVERVARGTPVWRYQPGFDQEIDPKCLAQFPATTQAHVRWFGWVNRTTGCWVLSGDHACFMNHDSAPNTGLGEGVFGQCTVALRDLAVGDEITCDYHAFDAEAAAKLGRQVD